MQPDLDMTGYAPAEATVAAERTAVGTAVTHASLAETVADLLTPADCWHQAHQVILTAALDLAVEGSPVDPVSVAGRLTERGQLHEAGGAPYLHTLQQHAAYTSADAVYYAGLVTADANRRAWWSGLMRGVQMASQAGWDPEASPGQIDDELDTLRRVDDTGQTGAWAAPVMIDVIDRMQRGRVTAIETGWADLDDLLQVEPGHLVILGAKTGAGKSMFASNIARHAAIHDGRAVLLSSLEMSREEFMERVLAGEARVPLAEIRNPKLAVSEDTWSRIAYVRPGVEQAAFFLDDAATAGMAHLRQRVRWMARQGSPPQLLIVDYLQLLTPDTTEERRDLQIAALARDLRALAKEHHLAVIALSQLSRAADQRASGTPQLSDLRESGAIEHTANAVLLADHPDDDARTGEVDLHVAKNRGGSTGTVTLAWQPHRAQVADMAPHPNGSDGRDLRPVPN